MVLKAYLQNGLTFENIIEVKDSYTQTYEVMKEKMKNLPKSLIIANRDSIALAALNAALDLNLKAIKII